MSTEDKPTTFPVEFVRVPKRLLTGDFSKAEILLAAYVIRHQVDFGNERTRLSDNEILHGRFYGRDKAIEKGCPRMDSGSGISSRSMLRRARADLEERGLLHVETDDSDRARIRRYYRFNFDPLTTDQHPGPKRTPVRKGPGSESVSRGPDSVTRGPDSDHRSVERRSGEKPKKDPQSEGAGSLVASGERALLWNALYLKMFGMAYPGNDLALLEKLPANRWKRLVKAFLKDDTYNIRTVAVLLKAVPKLSRRWSPADEEPLRPLPVTSLFKGDWDDSRAAEQEREELDFMTQHPGLTRDEARRALMDKARAKMLAAIAYKPAGN